MKTQNSYYWIENWTFCFYFFSNFLRYAKYQFRQFISRANFWLCHFWMFQYILSCMNFFIVPHNLDFFYQLFVWLSPNTVYVISSCQLSLKWLLFAQKNVVVIPLGYVSKIWNTYFILKFRPCFVILSISFYLSFLFSLLLNIMKFKHSMFCRVAALHRTKATLKEMVL